jgi:hypothetical protein
MTNTITSKDKVEKIQIRMYRVGTGDFFILLFKKGDKVSFKMMIDCGCINAGKATFKPMVEDLAAITDEVIDLLVVTHEHSDHINGFEKCSDLFDNFTFKNVWFAWTESDEDPVANDLREFHSELGFALNNAVEKLNELTENGHYTDLYANEVDGDIMLKGKRHFIQSLNSIDELNFKEGLSVSQPLPTMVELLKRYKIIKNNTTVECLRPGEVMYDLPGAEGIRFYVLGPPRDPESLSRTEVKGVTYEKREERSTVDFSFLSALGVTKPYVSSALLAFEPEYEATDGDKDIIKEYNKKVDDWRKIDHDWLFSSGILAIRYERSINNTSLALAIQFEESEKVLLFAGDAEYGNWESWHKNLEWSVKKGSEIVQKKANYFLDKTVFYKVGHHLSQNGTAKAKGIDLMNSTDFSAMSSLDLRKILTGWLNTMPNDLLGADLIRKTKGKLFLAGDCKKILKNINTERVTISKEHEKTLNALNEKFNGEVYIDCEIKG